MMESLRDIKFMKIICDIFTRTVKKSKISDCLHRTCWTFCIIVLLASVKGFNIDTKSAVVHQGPNGSMFGFSVALHRDQDYSWLLVGAPNDQTDQPNVTNGGAVYRCSIDSPNICQVIPFDRAGPSKIVIRGRQEDTDIKSHQWFGATLQSSGENGAIVACAPRYVYFSTNMKKREPVGTCWAVRGSFWNFKEYSPCRTLAWGYHRQGSGQAGFSAAVTKDGRRLFIGAVGSWYWQGQLFSQDLHSKQSLFSTNESPEIYDDNYLGYSMAIGEFTGDNDPDVVVGVPRGNELTGKISLFNSTVFNLHNVSGDQMGSYFGYSVCVSDVNGDGLDDIIVGAPLYTNLKSKEGSYENGRVYVIYQSIQNDFTEQSYIDGEYARGRFGLSVAAASDINKDGFNDLLVGCPYGGKDGKGVLYLFHGSRSGIVTKPSQKIPASSIFSSGSFNTFSWAISGGLDLDENHYPDLLIGAYDSDKVIFLRSRPVIQATASLKISPENIHLDDKACKLGNGNIVSCVVVSFCLEFTGIGIQSSIGFVYHIVLDAENVSPRVFFLQQENQNFKNVSINLRKESRFCKSVYAYIQNNVRDKLTPINVQVAYDLYDPYPSSSELKPILDQSIANNLAKQVNIQKNCGKDNICIPDLKLNIVPNMHRFLIGDDKRLQLEIVITNAKEDAFEANLFGELPPDVDYVNIARVRPIDIHVSCSEVHTSEIGNRTLVCDIGNPLPADTTLTFKMLFAPSRFVSRSEDLRFNFTVNSTNKEIEETLYDNNIPVVLPVRVEVNMTIHGISEPQSINYNKSEVHIETKTSESDAGPEVIHVYAVGNSGPSKIQEAEVEILWPTFSLQNQPLLYLMDQPEVQGNGRCKTVPDVNFYSLKAEQKKPRSSSYSVSIPDSEEDFENQPGIIHIFGKTKFFDERIKRSTNLNDTEVTTNTMLCGVTFCTKISCTVYDLGKGEQVIFTIRSRLWKDTLIEMGIEEVQISSKLTSKIKSLPNDIDSPYVGSKIAYFVKTTVNPVTRRQEVQSIPWWILIMSISVGLVLLGLLALLLWWVGFFRRQRIQDQLKEPLNKPNRNGYHLKSGDEYL